MKILRIIYVVFALCLLLNCVSAQKSDSAVKPALRRTMTRTERAPLAMGGTITVVGAPNGAIFVEGWRKNEVEVTAEIEWQGASEADLAMLSELNTFAFDTDTNHIRILTTGTHDREMMKKIRRKVPKHLLEAVWKIDYTIKVPFYSDLDVNGGRGAFRLKGVDGTAVIKLLESEAEIQPLGGMILMTVGAGNVNLSLEGKSFRGKGVDVQLAKGDVKVNLPPIYNADADFSILRSGSINDLYKEMKPRDRAAFSEKSVIARIGNGGARVQVTVGDGNIHVSKNEAIK